MMTNKQVDQLVSRIGELDIMITEAMTRDNAYELIVLLEERGKSIDQLRQFGLSPDDEILAALFERTQAISEQIQQQINRYEQALQLIVQSASAKKAYTVTMALTSEPR